MDLSELFRKKAFLANMNGQVSGEIFGNYNILLYDQGSS